MATFNGQVAASADDATERADDSNFASNAVTNIIRSNSSSAGRNHVAFRIPNVTIPAGATINTCTASVYVFVDTQDDPNLDIFCEDVDDAADFSTNADIVNRTLTSASAAWVATGLGVGAAVTPDFASVLQEVIDRPGWASGQDIVVFLWARSDTDSRLAIRMQDNGTGDGPGIAVDYTEEAAGVEIGLVSETDSALTMTAVKVGVLGLVSEGETALSMTAVKVGVLGLVTETDSALAVEAAGGSNWWEAGGASGAVRVYQPIGAASLAASYIDLTGNQDAVPGVAPDWDDVNGWKGNGSTMYLTTGFVPQTDQSQTMIVRFSNGSGGDFLAGSNGTGGRDEFYIEPNSSSKIRYYNGFVSAGADGVGSGILAIAGSTGYKDGAVDVEGIGSWAVSPVPFEVYILCRNNEGTPDRLSDVYIQAIAIYDNDIGDSAVAAVTAAMAALPDAVVATEIGLVSESDSALGMTAVKVASLGQPTETDVALGVGVVKARGLGLATGTDVALPMTAVKVRVLGLVVETDTALGMSATGAVVIGLASETELALPFTAVKRRPLGLVAESDGALAVGGLKVLAIGLAAEVDVALLVSAEGSLVIGLVGETDVALGMTAVKSRPLGVAAEVDSGLGVAGLKVLGLGLVSEVDSGLGVGGLKVGVIGLVSEVGSGLGVMGLKVGVIGLVAEVDSGLGLAGLKVRPIGLVSEVDVALAVLLADLIVGSVVVVTDDAVYLVDVTDEAVFDVGVSDGSLFDVIVYDAER